MRARGGGVLSASALVAVGTSLLLAALVGVGLSELGARDAGNASAGMRAEAAAVVVPGVEQTRKAARHPAHRRRATTDASPQPVTLVAVPTHVVTAAPVASTTTSTSTRSTASSTTSSPTPSPSPTRAHGNGKATGSGGGHQKPAKH